MVFSFVVCLHPELSHPPFARVIFGQHLCVFFTMKAQHRTSRMVGDRAGSPFLTTFGTLTGQGRWGAGRTLTAVNGDSSGCVTALAGALFTRLRARDFVLAGRHLLSLSAATTISTRLCAVRRTGHFQRASVCGAHALCLACA